MNWPFLTLTILPVAAAATHEVGLAAQERRDLQHVGDRGRLARPAPTSWTSVRIGTPVALAHGGEDLEARARGPGPR